MKRIALAAAVGAAVVGLTACSQTAARTAANTDSTAGHASATKVVVASCRQQYNTWQQGEGKGVMAALNAIGAARSTYALKAALREHRPAVARAAGHPIPGCADPRGYWDVLLMHLTAATADKGSASGATAAIAGVPEIEHQLTAELKQTAR